MPKCKSGYYAVAVGRRAGIYETWAECLDQVKGFSGAKYKKFLIRTDAESFISTSSRPLSCGSTNSSRPKSRSPYKRQKKGSATGSYYGDNSSQSVPSQNKSSSSSYYAVARGYFPGVYRTWAECSDQVQGYKYPKYRKFDNEKDAVNFCCSGKTKTMSKLEDSFGDELEDLCAGGFSPEKPNNRPPSPIHTDDFMGDGLERTLIAELMGLVNTGKKSRGATRGAGGARGSTRAATRSGTRDVNRHVVYTDGSCLRQGGGPIARRQAGIGVYWGAGDTRNLSERLCGVQTNQRAELWAAIRAVQTAISNGYSSLEIRTDSQYTINGITDWIKKWRTNGYMDSKGGPVKNKELFSCLDSLTNMIDLTWVHVKAHAGHEGNEAADELAKRGAEKQARSS